MKVRDTMSNPGGITGMSALEGTKVKAGKGAEFHNQLARAEDNNYELYLQKLVKDIVRQGETLAKRVDVGELRVYKKMISEFLAVAVGHSKKFSKKNLIDKRGRHRVYAIIKNIDEELDLLTKDVMSGEQDNMSLLQRLDDIRGLILDLFM